MSIKLSDYIKNPEKALTEEDWEVIYEHLEDLDKYIQGEKNNEKCNLQSDFKSKE